MRLSTTGDFTSNAAEQKTMIERKPIPADIGDYVGYERSTGVLFWKRRPVRGPAKAGDPCGSRQSKGYLTFCFRQEGYLVHRVVWFLHTGNQPPDIIDHADGDKANNAFENLRAATHAQNSINGSLFVSNKSGFRGVSWNSRQGKFLSRITHRGTKIHLGYHDLAEEAASAYAAKSAELNGEFATNGRRVK
jgi:hypothetical protein